MKKEITVHYSFLASFLVFASLINGWFDYSYWVLWVGAIIGTALPDVDHLIYIKFLKPQELTSQRFNYMISNKEVKRALGLLYETREERTNLIFHTALFQAIFSFLTFLVLTSSPSLLAMGIVLAFYLHLVIDQLIDFMDSASLQNWTRNLSLILDKEHSRIYLIVSFLLLFVFLVLA